MNQKGNQVDLQLLKKEGKTKQKLQKPTHDTEKIENNDPEFWKKQSVAVLRDQLNKIEFRQSKINCRNMRKPEYLAEVIKRIAKGDF